jgi:hypothetical protein
MVEDLTQYLFSNNMLRFIEGYVQKVCKLTAKQCTKGGRQAQVVIGQS